MIDKQGLSTGKSVRYIVEEIENDLLLNYRSYFTGKRDTPLDQVDFKAWEDEKIRKFQGFRESNKRIIRSYRKNVEKAILSDLEASYSHGIKQVESKIKQAKKKGIQLNLSGYKVAEFKKNSKVKAEILQMQNKLNAAYNNSLKMLDEQYLNTVKNTKTQKVASTLFTAIDKASAPLLMSGVVGMVTTNGRKMNLANYMELNTIETSQELLFIGEGEKSSEAGVYTVYITIHASSCELCTPWQNKILIDDVYQNGKPDGKHELLSVAIKGGLMHFGCRHNRLTYVEGLDTFPERPDHIPKRTSEQEELYRLEQSLRYNERKIREWKRRASVSLSAQEVEKANLKKYQYQARQRKIVESNKNLYRNYWREKPGFKMPKDDRWANLKYDKKVYDQASNGPVQ